MTRSETNPRAWIVVGLALLLLTIGSLSVARRIVAEAPELGVEWVQASAGPLAMTVDHEGVAWRAGLRPGDLLREIDGVRVQSALDAAQMGWETGERPIRLLVERGGSPLPLHFIPHWKAQSDVYVYLLIVGMAFLVSGLFIALRWKIIRGGGIYSYLALCLFALLTCSQTGRGDALDWTIHWVDVAAAALAPALLLHLAVALSRRRVQQSRPYLVVAYSISAGLMLSAVWLSPGAQGGAYRFADPLLALEVRDRIEPLALAVSLLFAVGFLIKGYSRSSSALRRSQMRWVLWGLGVGLAPSVLLYAVPWALGAAELPSWAVIVAVAPMLFVPAAFTAALARYRLHDLDLLMLRAVTEVTGLFCTAAVYTAAVFLLREGVNELLPLSRSATRYIGFVTAAMFYPQMRNWVRAWVERAFYRKRYSYRATLLDWARDLNADTDLRSLLHRLRERVQATLGVPAAEVLLRSGETTFEAIGGPIELGVESIARLDAVGHIGVGAGEVPGLPWARYLFSLKVKGTLRAVMALAEREAPEEPLTSEDRALLGTMSAHAATAIEAARLVREVRRRVEEVEQLHARQATILESSAVGLLLLDGDGRVQAWNRALEEIYGLGRDEAIGKRLSEIFPLHVVRRLEHEARGAEPTEESRIFRLNMVNRKGARVVANLALSPVEGDGSQGARVVTIDDVTEQVKLEERVLRQERLASLGLLAAGVAHEINTPLTGISSYAQLLLEESEPEDPRRKLLEKIESQTLRASKITSSLLDLARPERTLVEALDLNALVQEVLQLFRPQVRGLGIELTTELDPGLPGVLGHKAKLQQVLLNLLINARDAVDRDGLVRIVTRRRDDRAVVEVIDNGAGIAEEDLSRIFDPFFTTKGRGKGTGLGLSVTYGIVQEHNGEIHVESEPGEFTRFHVEIPLVRPAEALG